MTARDPFSVAAGNEAARISARVEKRLRELESAYVTLVNGIPVAYTQEGWFTQDQVDAKIASRQPPA
jgi:hypothetical protein